jgi:hypothetical protein
MGKKTVSLLSFLPACVVLCTAAGGQSNSEGSWQLHFAGAHNPRANICALRVVSCEASPRGDIVVDAPGEAGRYDVYVLALDVGGIAGTRYGVCCDGAFYFYGWTKCSDFEIPTTGWPGGGEGNAQTWTSKQPGPHVTVGILDVYVYGVSSMCACADPRKGFAEFCNADSPNPACNSTSASGAFGCVGFGKPGHSSCGWGGEGKKEQTSWGRLKATYRQ